MVLRTKALIVSCKCVVKKGIKSGRSTEARVIVQMHKKNDATHWQYHELRPRVVTHSAISKPCVVAPRPTPLVSQGDVTSQDFMMVALTTPYFVLRRTMNAYPDNGNQLVHEVLTLARAARTLSPDTWHDGVPREPGMLQWLNSPRHKGTDCWLS
ncbi:hypothetical protein VFPPC_17848 [Pochonia chlamydosporia 170]|uniref:Uncharacterized protein n=1 Tax=Pochonia chlamydosporia 170 TaxID=1380566 RepID=A0A219AQR9_METCM|nr:hypothetical protein VFPPC_17848 [Pochonia chlamydosporia 170]OWT42959.1 hypothetical protein VFPPC_17848 [Pochonia chlamydosporia 170]